MRGGEKKRREAKGKYKDGGKEREWRKGGKGREGDIFTTSGDYLYLLLSTKKEPKSLPPDTISGLKMYHAY